MEVNETHLFLKLFAQTARKKTQERKPEVEKRPQTAKIQNPEPVINVIEEDEDMYEDKEEEKQEEQEDLPKLQEMVQKITSSTQPICSILDYLLENKMEQIKKTEKPVFQSPKLQDYDFNNLYQTLRQVKQRVAENEAKIKFILRGII